MKINNNINSIFALLAVLFLFVVFLPSKAVVYSETVPDFVEITESDSCTLNDIGESLVEPLSAYTIPDSEVSEKVIGAIEHVSGGKNTILKQTEIVEEPAATCRAVSGLDDCEAQGMCDADGDGVVDVGDAGFIQQYILGLSDVCGFNGEDCFCDLNGDGSVTNLDALFLKRYVMFSSCDGAASLDDCVAFGMCDADGDGVIDSNDSRRILEFIAGVTGSCGLESNICFCDISGDDRITTYDSTLLSRYLLGECGNGVIEAQEECDDGVNVDGDGCSSLCGVEDGWKCSGEPSVCTRKSNGGGGFFPVCTDWGECLVGIQEKTCNGTNSMYSVRRDCTVKVEKTPAKIVEGNEVEKTSSSEGNSALFPPEIRGEIKQVEANETEAGNELTGGVTGVGKAVVWPFLILVIIIIALFVIYALRTRQKDKKTSNKSK